MPERSYGGLVTIAHFKGIEPGRIVLILRSAPPHSNSFQPIPAKVCAKHELWLDVRFIQQSPPWALRNRFAHKQL